MPVQSRLSHSAKSLVGAKSLCSFYLLGFMLCGSGLRAADWPMWRYDAGRTAVCSAELPGELHLHWHRKLPPQIPAWKDETSMQFDRSYEPIIVDGLLLVGSTVNGRLTAYRLDSGVEAWRFYTEGPIRLAPAAWKGKVYLASDDGFLYCLNVNNGRLRWKFRAGPSDRWLLGNERLVSTWPVRGGPVVADGKVFLAAGVWPFMGTFIYALNAETGDVVWSNDSLSFTYRKLPHPGAEGFSGLSPQGYLSVVGDKLIVPGSRFRPAVLDRNSGKLEYFGRAGSPVVVGRGRYAFAGGRIFRADQDYSVKLREHKRISAPVLARDRWYTRNVAVDPASMTLQEMTAEDSSTQEKYRLMSGRIKEVATYRGTPLLLAADRLLVANGRNLELLDVSEKSVRPAKLWNTTIDGDIASAVSANSRLIVITLQGDLYCFAPDKAEPRRYECRGVNNQEYSQNDEARRILERTKILEGCCIVSGAGDAAFIEGLIRQSRHYVIVIDSDAESVNALRKRLDSIDLYGPRCTAIVGRLAETTFVPYLANLIIVSGDHAKELSGDATAIRNVFTLLRPYGGTAWFQTDGDLAEAFARQVGRMDLSGAQAETHHSHVLLRRMGALPDAADWSGQNADAGNTRCSRDQLVKAPLGVLWFGNALSNELVLPRHGEGPVQQVAGGRMFVEGPDSISAVDVYTGRLLWTRRFPEVGKLFTSTKHQLGAHSTGSNFYAVDDAVYVALEDRCEALDPATGKTQRTLRFDDESAWHFLLVYQDLLIAGRHPIVDRTQSPRRVYSPTSSQSIVVIKRTTGDILWRQKARHSFAHYGIVAGNGRIYCIDRVPIEQFRQSGHADSETDDSRIVVFDALCGDLLWEKDEYVGRKLSYAAERDILLSHAAFRGSDGRVLWHNSALEEPLWAGKWGLILCGDTIISQTNQAFDLQTGKPKEWLNHDGNRETWSFPRSHGCGPVAGSSHLLTFRSGCAGFYDLARDGGTGNFGGFRSGCTSNLIVANGVLCAPDYTRTCTCEYQNRSSLGMVTAEEVEYWTYGGIPSSDGIGINFGAPGDRKTAGGALWMEYPQVGGQGFDIPINVSGAGLEWFYRHSSRIKTGGPKWVASSGVEGVEKISIDLSETRFRAGPITVFLHFAEHEAAAEGQRIFDVRIEGRTTLHDFDIVEVAGGPSRAVVREFRVADWEDELTIHFDAGKGSPVICGMEIRAGRADSR